MSEGEVSTVGERRETGRGGCSRSMLARRGQLSSRTGSCVEKDPSHCNPPQEPNQGPPAARGGANTRARPPPPPTWPLLLEFDNKDQPEYERRLRKQG